ncbi:MAG: zf-HC2 domain-containing protein [bacterium]|nr:zf-HC2 domain-containing protein [bacterium]
MKEPSAEFVFNCPSEEISAYIDGELTAEIETALELHFGTCDICRRELNDQKGFLLVLSDSLERDVPIELPEDFTRSIVVNAESKVSGLRDHKQRPPAFLTGTVLVLLAALALGSFTDVFSRLGIALDKILALVGAIVQIAADLLYAMAAMFRSLLQIQTFSTTFTYIAISLTVVLILYFGSRSLRRYFRAPGA